MRQYDGHYLIKECQKCGAEVERGRGDHVKVKGPTGQTVIPDRVMGKGLWCTVLKQLLKAGVKIALVLCAIACIAAVMP
jgi:predicted RNA binding protein YcfA (HicA-like mRNA interferase family)